MTDKEAFSGIRVLDFSQGIAGPHSAMLLAQHGADVIKAEPSQEIGVVPSAVPMAKRGHVSKDFQRP